ncbi:MAG: bifunctional [glutamine synthetase] adenylyltransferase/[glutamine synthetase]-adenylyl-L-tyrosine phosphorylase [Rhodospirillaceae bacterium]
MIISVPCNCLPPAADSEMAARGLADWYEAANTAAAPELRDFALDVAASVEGRRLIASVCGNSPYLGLNLTRDLPFARRLLTGGLEQTLAELLFELERDFGAETNIAQLMTGLRLAKRRAALLIGIADISAAWSLEQVTGALSDVAETTLGLAVNHLLRREAATGVLVLPDREHPLIGSGLIILAMGKFGARELNYSSDIDLIIFYDDSVAKSSQPENLARTFVRLARDLVRIMDERTHDGYVFRTDLRLRPDPGATPAAVSVTAAQIYYASVGQNWERAALIKARPVASDPVAASAFMTFLAPFIWRRNLDFAAIQDIHSVKRQIHAHKGHSRPAVNGHDIKLGRGGIREIEFFVQTQQLIYGGRDSRLRVAPTCAALAAFVALDRLLPKVHDELVASYAFLRRVEHRLQMVDDQQTHQLPKSDEDVARIAIFLGYDDPLSFRDELLAHLMRVEGHYADLFEGTPSLAAPGNLVFTGPDDDPGTAETLRSLGFTNPAAVIITVANWHRGRYRCMRSARAREVLTEITPALLVAFGQTHHPDEALASLDVLLGRLPAGVQLFSLFYSNPKLLEILAKVMGTAPRLAQLLATNPALLEAVVTPDFFDPLPDKAALTEEYQRTIVQAVNFEDVLNLSRRWVHDQSFRAGIHLLQNITDGDHCGPFLSALADIVLVDLLERVSEDFARRFGRIKGGSLAIIAMGKLGSGQMTIASDLDLITVYEVPPDAGQSDGDKPLWPSEYYIKLTQRLINVITAPTREGRLYEVDMRLRPSGNSGPVAISLNAFTRYQHKDAWTWEHMALTRARVIGGSTDLQRRLGQVILTELTRLRPCSQLVIDVADMRRRIDREFSTKNPWEVKYARGGFIDINFIAQYLMLYHAHDHPEVLSTNTVKAFEAMAGNNLLDHAIADDLIATHRCWRRIQGFLRLTTGGSFDADKAPLALRLALTHCVFPESKEPVDFSQANRQIISMAARAFQWFQVLIDEPAEREHLERQRNQVPVD